MIKLSLSRPVRFDVMWPMIKSSLARLRLTFTGPKTYRRYLRCSHHAGCYLSAALWWFFSFYVLVFEKYFVLLAPYVCFHIFS